MSRIKRIITILFPDLYYKLKVKRDNHRFNSVADPVSYFKNKYYKKNKTDLDLKNPKTFYEKINYLKFFYNEPNPEKMIDKYEVKDFLKQNNLEKYCTNTINIFGEFSEFYKNINDIAKQYNDFVVKLTHTSGEVFFFNNGTWRDKKGYRIPKKLVYACLKNMIDINYYHTAWEKIYDNLKGRIIVEKFVPSLNNAGQTEYKFFCNYGEPKMINVVQGRQSGDQLKEAFTDANLICLDARQDQSLLKQDEIIKPKCFDEMIEFCRKTVSDRPLIRVDLMSDGNTFNFCEFTFYDCSGNNIFHPLPVNITIGDLFNIDKIVE